MRKFPNTYKYLTLSEFLIANLRGPAIKRGDVNIFGHNVHIDVIASRVRQAFLFEDNFQTEWADGPVSRKKPPELPRNVIHSKDCGPAGAVIAFKSPPENVTMDFVPQARVMGPLGVVKKLVLGKKFFVLNSWQDFICLQLE